MGTELTESILPPAEALSSAPGTEGFVEAFADLYADAYQHAYKLLGDRQEAEDLAQEACTRACLRWRHLDNPQAWVLRVTTNLAFDRFRRLRSAAKHLRLPPTQHDGAAPDERHVDLNRALAKLPKRQRDVVVLRYLADFSEAQTAATLGCSPGTVKSHAARGLHALRATLERADEVETS
jgi:RNA polymerase sigma-70 factor (sigma-E family)